MGVSPMLAKLRTWARRPCHWKESSLLQQPHRHLTRVAMVPGVVWDGEQVAIALDDVHAAEEVVAEYVRVVAVRLRAEVAHLPAVVHTFNAVDDRPPLQRDAALVGLH